MTRKTEGLKVVKEAIATRAESDLASDTGAAGTVSSEAQADQHDARSGPSIEMAQTHYAEGRLHLAEEMTRALLLRDARNHAAASLLGIIAFRVGRLNDAIAWMARASNGAPRVAAYHSNLCEFYRVAGRADDAMRAAARAVMVDPNYAQGHSNLAVVYIDGGDYGRGEAAALRALSLAPDSSEAYFALANALRGQRRFADAEAAYRKVLALQPKSFDAMSNCGMMLRDRTQYKAAEILLRQALRLRPANVDAHIQLAINSHAMGLSDEALRLLTHAVALEPSRADGFHLIARILSERGKVDGAIAACRRALKAKPDHPAVLNLMGKLLRDTSNLEEAIAACRKALEQKPDAPDILNNLGIALLENGDLEGAAEVLSRAAALDPLSPSTYINLASARKFKAGDPEIAAMEKLLPRETPGKPNAIGLRYALGKAYDDVGEHERAFAMFAGGAGLRRQAINYNEGSMMRLFERIIGVFTPELIAEKSGLGDPDARPVFIVGMPRSGSTLIEQILASHSEVQAMGEVKTLHNAVLSLDEGFSSSMRYPELMHLVDGAQLDAVARHYRHHLPELQDGRCIVTDKMLTNYYYVGLIYLLFPNARVIYSRRNPVDTCLSCFSKLFKEDMAYTYELSELAHYHNKVVALMEHWKRVLPQGFILDVDYENVVSDIEGSARAIVAHCGLTWEPACLDFHKNERVVKTASVAQVRRPLYASSVERWRKYGQAVEPLVRELGFQAE